MQMVSWMVVTLLASSRAVRSDATAVNGTETNTETPSGTRTTNTVTSTGTPTSTPTSGTLGFSVCLGDAETYNAGYGHCSTYAPSSSNFNFCHLDSDSDDLFAQQVCPQCGLCYLNYTTTGTSTGSSTTILHTTTTTPHTTNEIDSATATPFVCLGDAGVFETSYGNCSTYARGQLFFAWCHYDSGSEGLLAEQVCPECGLCYLATSTTSAHTTTGTSTGSSTTSLQTTTDTSSTTTPHTTTETDSATATLFACLGDAGVFETEYGNCGTYAREAEWNFAWCYYDSDSEGLLAEQVCPQCELCYLATSTTSAHTTTGTSTETSTTSAHTTTGTSTSTTPHTTTGTDTTTYTQAPCSRAVEAVARAVDWGGECIETVSGTCPATCLPVLEDAIAVCDGDKNTIGRYVYAYQGGPIAGLLGFSEGACREVFLNALLSSTVYTPDCLDGLILLSTPISSCLYGDDNTSACPELCERAMDAAFDRCSETDVIAFGEEVFTAGQLVDFASEELSDQCFAVLSTKTFLSAGVTSTAMDKSAVEEWASTTVDHGTGSANGSFAGTTSSGAATAMSSSSTSGGGSALGGDAEEEEEQEEVLSSSHESGACLLVLSLVCLLTVQ